MSVEVVINMQAFERAVFRQAKPIIERDLEETRTIILEEFDQPKSGRIYRRPGGGEYQASAAGQPPAKRSGDLESSITEPEVREQGHSLVGEIRVGGQSAPYPIRLERGTDRMKPRPFVRPAIEEFLRRRA